MRKLVILLVTAWVAVLALLLVLPLVDATVPRFVPALQALWGAWLLLALATVVVAGWRRRWWYVAVVVAATGTGLLPILTAGDDADPAAHGPTLTVLAANVQYGQGDPTQITESVRQVEADVLVLSEVDRAYLRQLRDRGLADDLPHGWELMPATAPAGTTILSARPMTDAPELADPHDYAFVLPIATVGVGGTDVVVRGVHSYPPAPAPATRWRAELEALDAWVDGLPDDLPVVMAGDFNSARSHPAFRELTDDLAIAPGPASRTWPDERLFPPFVGIDHVLARHLAPVDSGSFDVTGSDHDAVWARLVLREP